MSLLPASTNAQYHGAAVSAWFLALAAVMSIIPGAIHYFLPDGGAGVIAGIDLGAAGQTIIAVFAWYGAIQIPFGLLLLAIALRYRPLVPLALLMLIVMAALSAWSDWLGKGAHGNHHPPGHYGHIVTLVLALVFLVLALRQPSTR
ncbi:hypothetical protein EUV02_11510 [Polymorphobacter arshaanensis]|uniref:DUF4345 domain-containing protein n=1 Tax=Glacieibacterium arshaanense TaxID=2511025 RepID=A0A4Y9ENY4_9SPHN|nr:hypothetical protein [Polymorphobacter arshaanensis]TFU03762.1 hypothetical protein EUV02_11510 [Polymorphobacter arshaanensis]